MKMIESEVNNAINFKKNLNILQNSEPITKYFNSFIQGFSRRKFTLNQKVKLIEDFLNFIRSKFSVYEPFNSLEGDDLDKLNESIEKLIHLKLYDSLFSPLILDQNLKPDDEAKDVVINQRVKIFSWIELKHLGYNHLFDIEFITVSINNLLNLNSSRSPLDKIYCILNCCQSISS